MLLLWSYLGPSRWTPQSPGRLTSARVYGMEAGPSGAGKGPRQRGTVHAPRTRGLPREEQDFRVRKGFLSEERGSYQMGGPVWRGLCAVPGETLWRELRDGGHLSKEAVCTPGGGKCSGRRAWTHVRTLGDPGRPRERPGRWQGAGPRCPGEEGVDTDGPRAAACRGRGLSRAGLGWCLLGEGARAGLWAPPQPGLTRGRGSGGSGWGSIFLVESSPGIILRWEFYEEQKAGRKLSTS